MIDITWNCKLCSDAFACLLCLQAHFILGLLDIFYCLQF